MSFQSAGPTTAKARFWDREVRDQGSRSIVYCVLYIVSAVISLPRSTAVTAGVGAATDSRQLLDSRVYSYLVVAYSRVLYSRVRPTRTLKYSLP